jgi:PAS domain S-box-containing protein
LVITQTKNSAVITDAEGRIEWVNKSFETTTGYQLEEVLGQRPKDFYLKRKK